MTILRTAHEWNRSNRLHARHPTLPIGGECCDTQTCKRQAPRLHGYLADYVRKWQFV